MIFFLLITLILKYNLLQMSALILFLLMCPFHNPIYVMYPRNQTHFKDRETFIFSTDPIYPTPPLAQDMTQGQFLSGV